MITISILGLDQYVVGHYSADHTAKLAKLFETTSDHIYFYAPESFLFHDGVEQTSWNTLVRVNAPAKFRKLQDVVAKYLLNTMSDITIHCAVEFSYYQEGDRYEKINKDYPRFITDANIVAVDDEAEESDDPDELYEGNVFAELEKKAQLEGLNKPESKDKPIAHECTCDHDHGEGCCEDGTCDCDHEKGEGCCDDGNCDCTHDHPEKHHAK